MLIWCFSFGDFIPDFVHLCMDDLSVNTYRVFKSPIANGSGLLRDLCLVCEIGP